MNNEKETGAVTGGQQKVEPVICGPIRLAGPPPRQKSKSDQKTPDPDPRHPLLDSMSRYPWLDAGDPEAQAAWEDERVQGLFKQYQGRVSADGRDAALRWLEDMVTLDPSLAEHKAFISTGVEPVPILPPALPHAPPATEPQPSRLPPHRERDRAAYIEFLAFGGNQRKGAKAKAAKAYAQHFGTTPSAGIKAIDRGRVLVEAEQREGIKPTNASTVQDLTKVMNRFGRG